MFNDDFLQYDAGNMAFVTRDEAATTFALKTEIPTLSGGLDLTSADNRYAPKTGSTVYALKTDIPDVSTKANVSDVGNALLGKADAGHTHTGVYAPASHTHGEYATRAELPDISGKANVTDVTAALATKADASHTHAQYAPQSTTYTKTEVDTVLATKSATSHTHTGVYQPVGNYAPETGSTVYATKAEVTEATGGGLTQTAGDARYLQLTDVFQEVTDIGDLAYAPINNSTVYALKSEIPSLANITTVVANVQGNVADLSVVVAGKADAGHNHDGTYAPVTTTYTKTEVDTALATKSDVGHSHPDDYLYYTFAPYNLEKDANQNVIGSYALVAHTHEGTYAPVGTTYTKTEVDTALATKAPATGSTVYQTTANMVKVGSETSYYSGAKVDALLTGLGGGSTPFVLRCTGAPGALPQWAWASIMNWTIDSATTVKPTNLLVDSNCIANNTTTNFLVISMIKTKWAEWASMERRVETTLVPASAGPYTGTAVQKGYAANGGSPQTVLTAMITGGSGAADQVWNINNIFRMPAGSWFGLNMMQQQNATVATVQLEWALIPM